MAQSHTLKAPILHCSPGTAVEPKEQENHGHSKITWRRSVVSEAQTLGLSWGQIETAAQDRARWRTLVDDLCPTGGLKD